MTNHRAILKAIPAVLLAFASGFASAAPPSNSQILAVSATVSGVCKFQVASTPLAFGSVDPSLSADKVVTANVLYRCSNGTSATGVTATGGTSRSMTDGGLNSLSYTLGFAGGTQPGTGHGAGNDLTLVVTGTITAAQYQNAVATTFSENVTLNILP